MMKNAPFFLLLFICSAAEPTIAQVDTNYVGSFANKNFIQLYGGSFARKIQFTPSGNGGDQHQITFSPNSSAFCGFVLGYKKLTLYGDIAIPQTAKVNRQQTNVRALSFFVSHFKSKWGFTGFVSYNKGLLMAVENRPSMYGNRIDIQKFTLGVHSYLIFNPSKFSYISANSQQMLQRKSAGSFIIVATPSYRIMQSPESIIPIDKSKYHLTGEMTMSKQIQLFSIQVKPGYSHNFTWKQGSYFLAPTLFVGTGIDYHLLQQTGAKHRGINSNFGYRGKLTTGINKSRYYATVELLYDHTQSFIYQSIYKNKYAECSINLGLRF